MHDSHEQSICKSQIKIHNIEWVTSIYQPTVRDTNLGCKALLSESRNNYLYNDFTTYTSISISLNQWKVTFVVQTCVTFLNLHLPF